MVLLTYLLNSHPAEASAAPRLRRSVGSCFSELLCQSLLYKLYITVNSKSCSQSAHLDKGRFVCTPDVVLTNHPLNIIAATRHHTSFTALKKLGVFPSCNAVSGNNSNKPYIII